jgi:transketolase
MTMQTEQLTEKARKARLEVLDMCVRVGEGRVASAFSCMEILVALYNCVLRYDINNPLWENRDRFIMSKSPGVVGLYPVLNDVGLLSRNELENFADSMAWVLTAIVYRE